MLAGVLLASACDVYAQQSVDYASVSGRVTDPVRRGGRGRECSSPEHETSVTATTATGRTDVSGSRTCAWDLYEIVVAQPGFRDATRPLSLTVGAAFELPVTLSVGAVDTTVTVTGEATVLEAARSQIAGTVPQAEVQSAAAQRPQLPRAGAAGSRRVADQRRQHAAVPGDVRGPRHQPVGQQPTQPLEQLHRRRALGQRRRGGPERHHVRRGRGRAGSGRDIRRPGGAGPRARRPHQHRHQERHEPLHGTVYDYLRDDRFNARNPLSGTTLPMDQSQFGGSLGGPIVQDRTFYFANVEQRRLDQTGLTTITPANVGVVNARLVGGRLPGAARRRPASTRIPSTRPTSSASSIIRSADGDQFSVRYSLYDVDAENSRGAGGSTRRAHRRRSTTSTRRSPSATC